MAGDDCQSVMRSNITVVALAVLAFILMTILGNFMHRIVLKPLSQPLFVPQALLGIFFGNIKSFFKGDTTKGLPRTLIFISEFGMMCYMFLLGLEMEPVKLLGRLTNETKVACVGMLSTLLFSFLVAFFSPLFYDNGAHRSIEFALGFSLSLASTASPLLTRLVTDLKIGKSDIGRFVVATGVLTDCIFMLILCLSYLIAPAIKHQEYKRSAIIFALIIVQVIVAYVVGPLFMNWVNHENPPGKTMKGPHLVLTLAFIVIVCACSASQGYNPLLSAFITGFCLPRHGRISRLLITKINYSLGSIFYPIYFFSIGLLADFSQFGPGHLSRWTRLVIIFFITLAGKVTGTAAAGALLGFHWPESVAMGLLLSVKGQYQMLLAVTSAQANLTTVSNSIIMVFVIILTVIYTPAVVSFIIKRARKRAPNQKMALQWLDPLNELRILKCLQGLHDVPSAINFMEICRGTADPGIVVYTTDMIELTDQIAATLMHHEGVDAVTVSDTAVTEMRERITNAIQAYVDENAEGFIVRRMLALSTLNNMHREICRLADELMVSLIILPFHKALREDGSLDHGHSGFRDVNRKVLKHAPCSVGILVDRGLSLINRISRSSVSVRAAVIFIGGNDDREAIAYTARVARHPGVKLTIIRFLLDTDANDASAIVDKSRASAAEQEEEMRLDDECFAQFYERHVATGHVSYVEKHLVNSAQTFSTIRSFQEQYELVIVGRGGRVNSVLTVGMNDWEQCPELGPIGDILSSTHFSSTASVLIIQQHRHKGQLDGLDDDFSIM